MPIDPVCGMQIDTDEALTMNYEGQIYYFCSDECRQEFREAPEEYVGEGAELLTEEEE